MIEVDLVEGFLLHRAFKLCCSFAWNLCRRLKKYSYLWNYFW